MGSRRARHMPQDPHPAVPMTDVTRVKVLLGYRKVAVLPCML